MGVNEVSGAGARVGESSGRSDSSVSDEIRVSDE
jgi:hypothetical protein